MPRVTSHDQRRAHSAYAGDYEHPGLGVFTVFEDGDDLRYEFGLLLRGMLLNDSHVADKFYMLLDPPLDYRAAYYADYPYSFPVYFSGNSDTGAVESVQVPYLEFSLPPTFTKSVTMKRSKLFETRDRANDILKTNE